MLNIRSTSIFERVAESVIAQFGRGNIQLRLVGTKWGLSYIEFDSLIRKELREPLYGTPRCQRLRAWDPNVRLEQLRSLEK